MADIRIKDLATTATTTASDDFMAVDGTTNGTRKLSAATPAFLTSVTTPSLTSPASTNLTLAGGAGNSSIILTPAGTGNVGIGTTSPAAKLHAYSGASGVSPVTGSIGVMESNGNAYFSILGPNADAKGVFFGSPTSQITAGIVYNYDAVNALSLRAAGATRLRIADTGDVSIASTTASSTSTNGAVVIGSGTGGGLGVAGAINCGLGATFATSSGNVGIGTTEPGRKLEVNGGIGFVGNARRGISKDYDVSTGDTFGMEQAGSPETGDYPALRLFISSAAANNYIGFGYYTSATAFTERMRIQLNGNVGIGTTTPNANALLDITSTSKAFMPPRMTTTQKNAIASPTAGMVVYDSTLAKLSLYTTAWETITSV